VASHHQLICCSICVNFETLDARMDSNMCFVLNEMREDHGFYNRDKLWVVRITIQRHLFFNNYSSTFAASAQFFYKKIIYIYINKWWNFQFSFFSKRKTNYCERKIKNPF
jgi:hypothetical protein